MKLVSMMGGEIGVESEPGEGSTFYFTVPLRVPAKAPARVLPVHLGSLRGTLVLVADGHPTSRRLLKRWLARWGMNPVAVANARSARMAIAAAKKAGAPFRLLLVDARLEDTDGFHLAEQVRQDKGSLGTSIVMMTAAGQLGDAARCREAGIEAYLTKPVPQAELLQALCYTLGAAGTTAAAPVITRHSLREGSPQWRVLVAEDSPVNRTLAIRLLEKRGHKVTTANDGREAVEAARKQPFDLILMDIQMPNMDGFEATSAIRALQAGSGRRTPIIALTAHALTGDREKCLQGGMDGYVTKPIQAEILYLEMDEMMRTAEVAH
jgi:CheY-like chemotaxis protein